MQLNVRKIEERIQKLQEIRRIAADPELVTMLLEFVAAEDDRTEPMPVAKAEVPVAKAEAVSDPRLDDAEIVNQVMKGMDGQGSSLLRKRA